MEFKLTEIEEARVEEFKKALIEIYGETGEIDYIFRPANGIGVGVFLHSHKAGTTKEITDYESW